MDYSTMSDDELADRRLVLARELRYPEEGWQHDRAIHLAIDAVEAEKRRRLIKRAPKTRPNSHPAAKAMEAVANSPLRDWSDKALLDACNLTEADMAYKTKYGLYILLPKAEKHLARLLDECKWRGIGRFKQPPVKARRKAWLVMGADTLRHIGIGAYFLLPLVVAIGMVLFTDIWPPSPGTVTYGGSRLGAWGICGLVANLFWIVIAVLLACAPEAFRDWRASAIKRAKEEV